MERLDFRKVCVMKKSLFFGILIITILTTVSCTNELRARENYLRMYDMWLAENQEWDTLYEFEENDLWGYMDDSGNIIIEPKFLSAHNFSEGLAFVVIREDYQTARCGYIDLTGEIIIPRPIGSYVAGAFSEGFAHVIERGWDWSIENPPIQGVPGPYIFIDRTGENIFGQEFINVSPFNEGFARVTLFSGRHIFIDRTGANAFGMELKSINSEFTNGYANVTLLNGPAAHIDRLGNIAYGWLRLY